MARSEDAEARVALGRAALARRDARTAETEFRAAIRLRPDLASGHLGLGCALGARSATAEAAASFERAARLAPADPEAHYYLGLACRGLGQVDKAAVALDRAVTLAPRAVEAHRALIGLLRDAGCPADALGCARRAAQACPDVPDLSHLFAELAAGFRFTQADPGLDAILLRVLDHPGVRPMTVGEAALSAVTADPAVAVLIEAADRDEPDLLGRAVPVLAGKPLLLKLMGLSPLGDPGMERLLTRLRWDLLAEGVPAGDAGVAFAAALAAQCFVNEYAFAEDAREREHADRMAAALAPADVSAADLAVIGAYCPLHRLDNAAALAARSWSGPVADLIRLQVEEPLAERALMEDIPAVTAIDDTVSVMVRAQYESNPYPRWVRASLAPASRTVRQLVAAMSGGTVTGGTDAARTDVLVAGCGTGQQALWAATSYAGARVLAVDLSRSSLAYALRQTRALGIEAIEYAQADLLRLGALARRFDVVECCGVLHHLGDPMAGWRVLADLVKPGGLMKIALYSEAARSAEVAAHRLIAERGYGAAAADIRRFRQDVLALPSDHPVAPIVAATDFHSISGCRDFVFHVQEHRFTIPGIRAALSELGLTFCGFFALEGWVAQAYRRQFPHDPAMMSLDNWHRFEAGNPAAFRQMYQFGALRPGV